MSIIALVLLTCLAGLLVRAQDTQTTDRPNGVDGFCYYCSEESSPPLCHAECVTAINNLCAEDLHHSTNETVGSCQILYLPQVYPWWRGVSRPNVHTESECIELLTGILDQCVRDATNSAVDSSYCTASGGGGTWGWHDDGSPVEGKARYRISTPGTGGQCGQTKALEWQADSSMTWDASWLSDDASVLLVEEPPPLDPALMSTEPTDNIACVNEICDIKGNPVYANAPKEPWTETAGTERHRVEFAGIDPQALEYAVYNRCGSAHVGNPQWWWEVSATPTHLIMDFDLPAQGVEYFDKNHMSDMCPCIVDALFDASGGILVAALNKWCSSLIVFQRTKEFPEDEPTARFKKKRRLPGILVGDSKDRAEGSRLL